MSLKYPDVKFNYNMMGNYIDNLMDFIRFYEYVISDMDKHEFTINFDTFNIGKDAEYYVQFFYGKLSEHKVLEKRIEQDFYEFIKILEDAKCEELKLCANAKMQLSKIPEFHFDIYGKEYYRQPQIRRVVHKVVNQKRDNI